MKYYRVYPYIVLISLSISLTGCFSPHVERTETRELEPYNKYEQWHYNIMYVHMKDSSIVDLWGKNARYMKQYKDVKNVIVYNSGKSEGYINIEDISYVVVEKNVINVGHTIGFVGLIILSAASVIAWLYLIGLGNMH